MADFTLSHWGVQAIRRDAAGAPLLEAWDRDPDPSRIGTDPLADIDALRVRRPAVRRSFLERGHEAGGEGRGREAFVEVPWDEALDLVAGEIARVKRRHGNAAIFGGSYGWASAGRFHHAVGQLHRFLNTVGGYVRHTDSYSLGAGRVLMPYILASMDEIAQGMTSWDVMAAQTRLFVSFGGVPLKNAQISSGGAGLHRARAGLERMREAGTRFVDISPVRDDLVTGGAVEWIPIRPGTDTALMLALCFVLHRDGLADRGSLDRLTVGYDRFLPYLTGEADGVAKTPAWAERITGVPARRIARLAHEIVAERSMLNSAWALQRADHGEQPFWALTTLAAMVGQIGLPGGGFGLGYGAMNAIGGDHLRIPGPTLPQGDNAVEAFIPCARIADMLLEPGAPFRYRGEDHRFPDIRLVYWAGGNPFHHHQDLFRFRRAWARPETVVVHEPYWTATARHADIVLPATTTLEREDIGYATGEGLVVAMSRARAPLDGARDDFAIFAALAERLGTAAAFTEGRDAAAWLAQIYDAFRARAAARGVALPDLAGLREAGMVELPREPGGITFLADFRADPTAHPLSTPSGRIEIYSERIAGFGEASCGGHARWYPPVEDVDDAVPDTLHLVSDQPARRLHGQLDHARWSRDGKVGGREPVLLNDEDARARGIAEGDTVRLGNARGACLATATLSNGIARGVAKLSTGAWFDPAPDGERLDRHGNPNAVTRDAGASALSQGCAAQSCRVAATRVAAAEAPAVAAFDLPRFATIPAPSRSPELPRGATPSAGRVPEETMP